MPNNLPSFYIMLYKGGVAWCSSRMWFPCSSDSDLGVVEAGQLDDEIVLQQGKFWKP